MTMLKNDGNYILPINSYITDIYDSSENKSYKIVIDEEDIENNDILVEFIPDNSRITLRKFAENENNKIKMEDITDNNGIAQKYKITDFNNDFILKIDVPHEISYSNYILRYYFNEKQKKQYYELNKDFMKIKENNDDIVLEFNIIQIPNITDSIFLKIFGILYKNETDIKNEFINTSETINKQIIKNQTFTTNNLNFKLYFSDIRSIANNNYSFNLQIKIGIENEIFNENLYMYKLPINLEEEFGTKNEVPIFWIIIISLLALIIIIIIAVLVYRIINLKMKNNNLQEKILTSSFENFDEGLLDKNMNFKKDEDKDNPFI